MVLGQQTSVSVFLKPEVWLDHFLSAHSLLDVQMALIKWAVGYVRLEFNMRSRVEIKI